MDNPQVGIYIVNVQNESINLKKEKVMAKGKDTQKAVKKKSEKTLKEKRQEKKAKKANKI